MSYKTDTKPSDKSAQTTPSNEPEARSDPGGCLTGSVPYFAPVQGKGAIRGREAGIRSLADEGFRGAAGPLPYLDRIQESFGQHDVTGVKAYDAPEATAKIGAEAYASGDKVALSSAPSLHTAAHEAAHVVQQRRGVQLKGGVGHAGDPYERQADRVADLVVRGASAEAELSGAQGITRQGPALAAIQRLPVASGAANRADVQFKLKLTGDQNNVTRALGSMNSAMMFWTATTNKDGYVTLKRSELQGPPSPQQQAAYDRINTVVSDAKDVSVNCEASSRALGGSYGTGGIDMDDLRTLGSSGGMTTEGALIHELVEQHQKQVKGKDYQSAHAEAIKAENEVNGSIRGQERVVGGVTQNNDGTVNATVEIPYTYPDGRVVTTTLTIVKNNITKAENKETTAGTKK